MQTELKSYIRNKKKTPIGMVIVKKNSNGKVSVGWSLCCKKDKYDKETGYVKASNRQYYIDNHEFVTTDRHIENRSGYHTVWIPQSAYRTVTNMINRANKYFKNENES